MSANIDGVQKKIRNDESVIEISDDFLEASATIGSGYVTAIEDSQISSLYYSVNESMEDTLEAPSVSASNSQNLDDTLNGDDFIKKLQNKSVTIVKLESTKKLVSSTPTRQPQPKTSVLKTPKRDENFDRFVNIIKSVEAKNKENIFIQNVMGQHNTPASARRATMMAMARSPNQLTEDESIKSKSPILSTASEKRLDKVLNSQSKIVKRITFCPETTFGKPQEAECTVPIEEPIRKPSFNQRKSVARPTFISSPLRVSCCHFNFIVQQLNI